MKVVKFAWASAILLALLTEGRAKDVYISQTGGGAGDGSSAANARTVAWLNTPWWQQASVWGTNSVNPGDTVHLVGAINTPLSPWVNGTPGNNVTILFESNAMLTLPRLTNTPPIWIYVAGCSNLVIDGGVNGVIQCTDNGTPTNYWDPASGAHGWCSYTNTNNVGIYANPVNNFTVQNLTISNLYNRLRGSDDPSIGNFNAEAIAIAGNNITIQNNYIYNTEDGFDFTYNYPATSNLTVINNTIMGFNHGIVCASGAQGVSPVFYNAIIRSNRIDGMDFYESTNSNVGMNYHRDPIFLFCTSVNANNYTPTNDPCSYYIGYVSNIDISCNYIGPGVNPQTTSSGSAGIFIHDYSTNQMERVLIYNNILINKYPMSYGDGFIDGGLASKSLMANNTLIGWTTNVPGPGTNSLGFIGPTFCGDPFGTGISAIGNYSVFNNILYNVTAEVLYEGQPTTNCLATFTTNQLGYLSSMMADYNVFDVGNGGTRFAADMTFCFGTGAPYSGGNTIGIGVNVAAWGLQAWQAFGPNFDPHSTTNLPALNQVTFAPLSTDTVARARGTNLAAYITKDFYGNPRPAAGAWDIGAVGYTTNVLPPPYTVVGYSTNLASVLSQAVESALLAPTGLHIVTSADLMQQALAGSLVAWYTFDEGTGTSANDSSGNGYDIRLTGNAWGAGVITNAVQSFNNNMGSYLPSAPALGNSFTVTFWLKPDSTSTVADAALWCNASAGVGVFYRHDVRHIDLYYGGADHFNSTAYTENQWLYITVVNNAGSVAFYLNGVANGSASGAPGFTANSVLGNGSGQDFKGYMDDLRIYNIALSAAEVAAQYQWPTGGRP